MASSSEIKDVEVLNAIISALENLDREDQERIIQTVITFYDIDARKDKATTKARSTVRKDSN